VDPVVGHSSTDTISAADLHFWLGQRDEAVALAKTFHYSHCAPTNIQLVGTFHTAGGLFGDLGPAVAAIFFSIPPTRWSEDVLELSRLVRAESYCVPLTRLISLACKRLKADGIDLLVSYADAGAGHHGGIYQACAWNYDGQRDSRMDGLMINGRFVPGRTCNHLYGTRSPAKLRHAKPGWKIEPHYDIGKHLYWRALSRSGKAKAARLGLKCTAYPKPDWDMSKQRLENNLKEYLL
jgi:hypothetical protein